MTTKRKAREVFSNDLEDAKVSSNIPDIADLSRGENYGSVSFAYLSESLPLGVVTIEALVPGMILLSKSSRMTSH